MLDMFAVDAKAFDGPVLLTGAGGCIGSWALAQLVRAGVNVTAFDLSDNKRRPQLLMSDAELARVPWVTGNIADSAAVLRAVEQSKARAILHLAALQVPFCKADPIGGAQANVVGTVNILEAARKQGIKRVAFASSIAAYAVFSDKAMPTLYGAYKHCNEQTARVYWADWQVPSVCFRPGVVYGVGRDQGVSSKTTVAILAAAAGKPYTIPFRGPMSWLHAGEVAHAFVKSISREQNGSHVFDINGVVSTVEQGVEIIKRIAPSAQIQIAPETFRFPTDLSDEPLRAHVGGYTSVPLEFGIERTYAAFKDLLGKGKLSADSVV
jgi:nucleoside-diphosphate-sugar epimerase